MSVVGGTVRHGKAFFLKRPSWSIRRDIKESAMPCETKPDVSHSMFRFLSSDLYLTIRRSSPTRFSPAGTQKE